MLWQAAATADPVERVREDSPDEQFAFAYRHLFDASMRLAYRMTRDAALAEDVAAEALARAYSRWSGVRDLEKPEAWVLRVTVNLVIDAARRHKLLVRALPSLALADGSRERFDEHVAVRAALVAELASLPRRQREAVSLRYLAAYDEEDISRSMQISPSSVRTHVQRGLTTLRARLGAALEEGLHAAL